MRCSTCGERLAAGRERCPVCGAVAELVRPRPAAAVHPAPAASVGPAGQLVEIRECPRCGRRSQGQPYFQKAGHLAMLVGLSIFTYGIGGLIYYARCRKRQVCAGCGFGWEHSRPAEGAPTTFAPTPVAPVPAASGAPGASVPAPPRAPKVSVDRPLPPSGIGRRIFGGGMAMLATLIVTAGIAGGDGPPILVGGMLGMAGSGLFLWGWKALQERRRTVLQNLNRKVLRLATRVGGVLTVTEVAAELDLSLEAAEKVLDGMEDGFRVRSDVSDEGVIYYEFLEVVHQAKLRAGSPA